MVTVDMENPEDVAVNTVNSLKMMNGKLDHIFFCHGIINYMGGIDAHEDEWDKVHNINVRSTM